MADAYQTVDDLKAALESSLKAPNPRTPRRYVVHGLRQSGNPGITVAASTVFGVPLSEPEVLRLRKYGRQGTDSGSAPWTVIDAKHIELQHPSWAATLSEIMQSVCNNLDLGVDAREIHAELESLLILGPGSVSSPLERLQRRPGSVGTLEIVLPCKHQGGDRRPERSGHCGTTIQVSTGSQWNFAYAAWVNHPTVGMKIGPITSGSRVSLVYNLVADRAVPEVSSSTGDCDLPSMLARWKLSSLLGANRPRYLVHLLDHHYTKERCRLPALTGPDQQSVRNVTDCIAQSGYCAYLVSIRHLLDIDRQAKAIGDGRYTLQWAKSLDGQELDHEAFSNVQLQAKDCVAHPARDSMLVPSGHPRTEVHYYGGILLLHKDDYIDFMIGTGTGLLHIIRAELRISAKQVDPDFHKATLRRINERLMSGDLTCNDPESREQILNLVMILSVAMQRADTFEWAAASYEGNLSQEWFERRTARFKLCDFKDFRRGLELVLDKVPLLSARINALGSLATAYGEEHDEFRLWRQTVLTQSARHAHTLQRADASSLARLLRRLDGHTEIKALFEDVMWLLQHRESNTAFCLTMCHEIFKLVGSGIMTKDTVKGLYEKVVPGILKHFTLGDHSEMSTQAGLPYTASESARSTIRIGDIRTLMEELIEFEMLPELIQLLDLTAVQCLELSSKPRFVAMFEMPLLKDVALMLKANHSLLIGKLYQQFFIAILSCYIIDRVGDPPAIEGYSMSARGCGCQQCQALDDFLASSVLQEITIPLTHIWGGAHIEEQLAIQPLPRSYWGCQKTSVPVDGVSQFLVQTKWNHGGRYTMRIRKGHRIETDVWDTWIEKRERALRWIKPLESIIGPFKLGDFAGSIRQASAREIRAKLEAAVRDPTNTSISAAVRSYWLEHRTSDQAPPQSGARIPLATLPQQSIGNAHAAGAALRDDSPATPNNKRKHMLASGDSEQTAKRTAIVIDLSHTPSPEACAEAMYKRSCVVG